jgi:hypothetical protein
MDTDSDTPMVAFALSVFIRVHLWFRLFGNETVVRSPAAESKMMLRRVSPNSEI